MTRGKNEKAPVFDASEFPGLKEFFSGYLHEDFMDEYGSPAGAARAFCGDASGEEAAQAREEWSKLRKVLTGRALPDVHAAFHKLGGAWQPVDMEELRPVDAIFAGKAKSNHSIEHE
jgi:hypothetical protein